MCEYDKNTYAIDINEMLIQEFRQHIIDGLAYAEKYAEFSYFAREDIKIGKAILVLLDKLEKEDENNEKEQHNTWII